ncbi:MAG TPA: ATPase, T2SS/T4P/T4SS family, partial [Candidatus Saccharimonadales bacterium]|nr:ATPase, T2SS/T4P/T4SS family [Candidatus Saccharimonadales bacterium]
MSVLSTAAQKQVEETLVKDKVLTQGELTELKEQAEKESMPLLSFLVTGSHVSDEVMTKTIAHVTRVPYVNLSSAHIDPDVLDLLPEEVAERYMAVPLGEMQNRLVVAMLDADNVQAVDFLANKIGRPLKVYAASESGIRQVLRQYQSNLSSQVVTDMSNIAANQAATENPNNAPAMTNDNTKNIKTIVQDSPISKALSTILEFAAKNNASDVHVEPLQDGLKIRCRIDGILREILRLPKSIEPPLVSRIKILANLKIDEHRVPQDGQFSVTVDKREIDLRIAISPV